jgi:hypothetical protein
VILDDQALEALVRRAVRAELGVRGDDWVTARSSGLGVAVFRAVARAGGFPVYRVGKTWRARRRDIDAWIESQRVEVGSRQTNEPANDAEDPDVERLLASGRYTRGKT